MGIGNNIKEQRTKLGLTQKNLADKLNVTAQAVSRWENEDVEPSIDTLKQLSSLFNISLDEFLNNDYIPKTEISNFDEVPAESQAVACILETVATETQTETVNFEAVETKPQTETSISETNVTEIQTETTKPNLVAVGTQNEISNSETVAENVKTEPASTVEMGFCGNCGKQFPKSQLKTKNSRVGRHTRQNGPYCPSCWNAIKEARRQYIDYQANEHARRVRFRRILGYILGVVAFAILFGISVALAVNSGDNDWMIIGAVAGVCAYFIIACALLGDNLVSNCFSAIAGLGIKFPGIIFTLDIDGIIFFILVKVLFGIITIIVSILLFIAACLISGALAVVYYPHILVISYKHPEDIDLF